MIRYVDTFKDQFGVEAICRIMRSTECGFLTARGYRAAKSRPPSARSLSDQLLGAEIGRLHAENYGVYGVRKMHALMARQGWALGRDQTGRIMRSLGLQGVKRSKRVFTTKSDPAGMKPKDLVQRRFTAPAPCRLWVVDITYVRTWQGFAYVAFVTDVFARKIVGFNVASTLKADILPLQALDMAAFTAAGDLTGLTHHSDHGSNYMSLVYTDRIVELGATPSTGTVGDSYDNALAEAINALYKTELIRQRGPWRTVEQVELATLEWVWWWNNQRLHSELGYRTPAEVEANYYADLETPETATAALGKQ
jgi:transposase InsO family protein